MNNLKNYVLSQRFKYISLGMLAGFFIGITQEPYNKYMIAAFVCVGMLASYWFNKKQE